MNINIGDAEYEAFKAHQNKYIKDNDTYKNSLHKNSLPFPMRSTVGMQHEERAPWTYGFIDAANNSDHRGGSYIMIVMKMAD